MGSTPSGSRASSCGSGLQRGVLKVLVGVFLGEDSESIRISELYSYNRFRVRVVPKTQIASIETLDLTTGKWPGD